VPTQEKVERVDTLKTSLDGVRAVMLTEYRGLSVQQLGDLRKQLRAVSAEYRVVKNRLARLAVTGSGLASLGPHLKGPTGMVIAREDPVSAARALHTFARTNQALTIKVGLIEGQVLPPAELRALSELPSRDTLRAQLVAAIEGPLRQLVGLLQAPAREIAYVLAEHGKTTDEGERPVTA
jgi:large subunit ribosomal protein L10